MKNALINIIATYAIFTLCILCVSCDNSRENRTHNAKLGKVVPAAPPKVIVDLPAPTVNVFIENSGSMYGYVKGVTSFEQAVYNYLSDIKIKNISDSLNLCYINSKIIPQGSDISDFIEKLEPTTFKQKGGNLNSTDISNLLKTVFEESCDNNVSILVSDFIFSPGKKDAEQYLINQQIGIKTSTAKFLESNPNHGILIYHLESEFNGYFYDKFDAAYSYKGNRPYYIWVIGHRQHLKTLADKCPATSFMGGGVINSAVFQPEYIDIDYRVKVRTGDFDIDKKDPSNRSIINAKKEKRGCSRSKYMTFAIDVDFSELLLDDNFLMDINNYEINDADYSFKITKLHEQEYSHTLYFSTEIVKPTVLNIKLKQNTPQWVVSINDDDGVGINEANSHKTYGFETLVKGVEMGYAAKNEHIVELKINVNQK